MRSARNSTLLGAVICETFFWMTLYLSGDIMVYLCNPESLFPSIQGMTFVTFYTHSIHCTVYNADVPPSETVMMHLLYMILYIEYVFQN